MDLFGFFRSSQKAEAASDRAAWLDKTIQSVGHAAQLKMLQDIRTASRNFEAAETPAWTDSWSSTETPINDALANKLPTLWARANGFARNNEWARAYLISLDDNVLGPDGMRLQMQIKLAGRGASRPLNDARANAIVESAWAKWGEHADVSGMSWRQVEDLALQTLARRGEMLYRHVYGSGPFGYQIQLLDPILLDVTLNRAFGGNRVRMGKEIDDAGKPVAYWLQASRAGDLPTGYLGVGKHLRVPASDIEHHYIIEEPHQLRGIPWMTVGARRLWLVHDFEEAAAVASSNAAKRSGFFYTPSGEAPPGFADQIVSSVIEEARRTGKVLSADEIQSIQSAADKFNTLVPGQFDTLPGNTQFQPFESKWPSIDASDYVKSQLRGFTASQGSSYVTVGNDLESVNYSSAQVGIIGEREHHKKTQVRFRDMLSVPVFRKCLPYLVAKTPEMSARRMDEYLNAASWLPRRWAKIDPVKEMVANELALKLKLTSRRRLISERGEDADEIFNEASEEDLQFGPIEPTNVPADPPQAEGKTGKKLHLAASRSMGGEG